MLSEKEIYQYLGLAVIVVIFVYVVLRTLSFQAGVIGGVVEGFSTDMDKLPDAVKANTNKYEDSLLITKYRRSHEDTILNLESSASAAILSLSITNAEEISKDPSSEKAQKIIGQINNLKSFRDSLNDAMSYLDKK